MKIPLDLGLESSTNEKSYADVMMKKKQTKKKRKWTTQQVLELARRLTKNRHPLGSGKGVLVINPSDVKLDKDSWLLPGAFTVHASAYPPVGYKDWDKIMNVEVDVGEKLTEQVGEWVHFTIT